MKNANDRVKRFHEFMQRQNIGILYTNETATRASAELISLADSQTLTLVGTSKRTSVLNFKHSITSKDAILRYLELFTDLKVKTLQHGNEIRARAPFLPR